MHRSRILLADDHQIFAEGLQGLLSSEFEVVGIAKDGWAMLDAVRKFDPDVVVADISMPLLNGIEAAERLVKDKVRAKVVFLTMHLERAYAIKALEVGASAYVLKHSASSELVLAIREVLKGRIYVSPMVSGEVLKSFLAHSKNPKIKKKRSHLTLRQREVLQLLAEGHTAKEVASFLCISPRTVEFHKYRVMKDLNLRAHANLVRYAIEHGIASI
ncbi:response regulator transcription factor [Nitrospira defluvii]|nr:response regulator transcription factor [Nitrospira defluvii]